MNRRTFIGTSIAASLIGTRPMWAAEGKHQIDRVGLQLYTVRDAMKQDFEGTLAKVSAAGYREVEFAGYFDHSPKEIRATLERHNLTAPSQHVGYDVVEKKWPETLETAHVVGHQYIVCPWIDEAQRKQPDGWKRAAELFNRAGEASQKAGIQFAYHNHAFEFIPAESLGGKTGYDFLLAETDAKLVKMELDLCWATVGGQDPVSFFERYPGRFPLVHVKDWKKEGAADGKYDKEAGRAGVPGHMADVGQGSIDWKRILGQSEKAGIKHYFVENDNPEEAFASIRTSYEYLAKLRF